MFGNVSAHSCQCTSFFAPACINIETYGADAADDTEDDEQTEADTRRDRRQ